MFDQMSEYTWSPVKFTHKMNLHKDRVYFIAS